MKKIYFLLVALLFMGCATDPTPRVGDIIFQSPNSHESDMISKISDSPISHCGIIVKKDDGSLHVLHIADRPMVTPLGSFINHGKKNQYCIKRATNEDVEIDYKKYLRGEKDYRLVLGGDKYYEAELVYRIYQEDLGIELCEPRPFSDYNIEGLEPILMQRSIKPNQPYVTPSDIFNSPKLKEVVNTYTDTKE